MVAPDEERREIFQASRLPASCGAFFLPAFQFSAFASGYASFDFV
jgi:hypothetical protein